MITGKVHLNGVFCFYSFNLAEICDITIRVKLCEAAALTDKINYPLHC